VEDKIINQDVTKSVTQIHAWLSFLSKKKKQTIAQWQRQIDAGQFRTAGSRRQTNVDQTQTIM